jgi:ADP-ribose pyrophosphatase YjhB (NUDIX family)
MLDFPPMQQKSDDVAEPPQRVCVSAALMHHRAVLVLRRLDTDSFLPGFWALPGGMKDGRETCIEALGRGLREELGHSVDLSGATPCHVFDYLRTDFDPLVVMTNITYLVRVHQVRVTKLAEHDADWVAEKDLGERRMTREMWRAIGAAFERARR